MSFRRGKTILTAVLLLALAATAALGAGAIQAGHGRGGSGDPVIVAAGDIAACNEDGADTTAPLLDSRPDATVLTLGDNAYPVGSTSDYTNCYEPTWGRAKARTRPTPGNHEYYTESAAGYFAYFHDQLAPFGPDALDPTKGWYSYDLGDWHLIALNSECALIGGCGAGSPQETWLRSDLAAHRTACTLAYWHKPRFNSGSVHGSNPELEPLWQALYDFHAEIVLSGHEHVYERFAPQTPSGALDRHRGIRAFTVGTGGRSHYNFGTILPNSERKFNDAHGILQLTLHPSTYDWEFIPQAGRSSTDSGSTVCNPPTRRAGQNPTS